MDLCDYCYDKQAGWLRVVGEFEGLPLVKLWCGACPVPDDIDPDANRGFVHKLLKKEEDQ